MPDRVEPALPPGTDVEEDQRMDAEDAAALYGLLTTGGMRCWVVGGWGVDALVGRQTRPHKDLDVLTLLKDLPALNKLLAERGFVQTVVWEENRWLGDQATAFVVEDGDGRQLDVHVMRTSTEPAWNAAWPYERDALDGHGVIAGVPVDCATAAVQIAWHQEYELPPAHALDLRLLLKIVELGNHRETPLRARSNHRVTATIAGRRRPPPPPPDDSEQQKQP